MEPECEKSSATTYFWYRQTLNTISTIADSGGLNVKMTLSLLVAWIIVCLAVIRGIASSGKVMYFSSLFPYVVLFCFLVRGLLLKGAVDGIAHMFTPKLEKMLEPQVWREAATQGKPMNEKCVIENAEKILAGYLNSNVLSHDLIPSHVNFSQLSTVDYAEIYGVIKTVRRRAASPSGPGPLCPGG
ncbi:hypothetical protein J4Q44_G00083430 [Coregonus suidteri]|uniref:Uncharacterized protein n=1 Tax=Coregonus suidteri TaxID=861788 RepID=A0AAN8RBY3_9TELE